MKKPINRLLVKSGILFFAALFLQATLVQASEAAEMTPFYKSWLKERSYTHPSLKPKTHSSSAKVTAPSQATASTPAANPQMEKTPFYKSWLKEHSYAHPGITSSAAVATPAKNISEAAPKNTGKGSTPEYKSRPEYNVCNFVCLSTCKTCSKSSSSNYLMSKE